MCHKKAHGKGAAEKPRPPCRFPCKNLQVDDTGRSTRCCPRCSIPYWNSQEFPIFQDRMPLQLLAYMRLSRVTDPAQLASVSFPTPEKACHSHRSTIIFRVTDCICRCWAYNYGFQNHCLLPFPIIGPVIWIKFLPPRDCSEKTACSPYLLCSDREAANMAQRHPKYASQGTGKAAESVTSRLLNLVSGKSVLLAGEL